MTHRTISTIESDIERRSPAFERDALREAITQTYSEVARDPSCGFHFNAGAGHARSLGYGEMLDGIPEACIDAFAGVGNPFLAGPLLPGETVLDIGSGGGMDVAIAARKVGPTGRAIGVDMTDAMIQRAERAVVTADIRNAWFISGHAESIPVVDEIVDVVISNGVINLAPDKRAVLAEAFRVLRPGGRLQIADVVLDRLVPKHDADLVYLWTDCVAGAITSDEYTALLEGVGFEDVVIGTAFDAFAGADVEHNARKFGARGVNIVALKPVGSSRRNGTTTTRTRTIGRHV